MTNISCQSVILVFVCALLSLNNSVRFGKATSSVVSNSHSVSGKLSQDEICKWRQRRAVVWRCATAAHKVLLLQYHNLSEEHKLFTKEMSDAIPISQLPSVLNEQHKVNEKFWDAFWLVTKAGRSVSQLFTSINVIQEHIVDNMNFSHCNTTTPVASHVENTNFSDIVEELKRNVSELFNFSSIKNNTYILNYSKTLDKRMLPLKNGEGLSLLAEEVRKGFDLTKQKLKETHGRKQVFDVKVAFGCELEKRLNVIKDTFVALEFMLKGVLAREGILLRRATALQANATKLGVVVPGMDDTQGIRKEVSSALTEVSATLTKVLSAMYNTPTNSHSLLSYDSEFYHGIIHCRGDTQMERTVLLHLAADERRNHFGDYITWKGVISALWNEVTPALGHAHLNCSGMENISCESILNQANALIGELARSRESAEAILGDAIKVLMAVDEQIERSRSILDAAVSQRVAGHGAESADTPWTGKSLMGGFANSGFDDMFDEADDIDKNEGGDFYSGDDVGGVRSGRRAITIVLAVVVPIIVIAFACGALCPA